MSAACSPPPPIRPAAHTSAVCGGPGLFRVDTALLPGAARPPGAPVPTPASDSPRGLGPPTATS